MAQKFDGEIYLDNVLPPQLSEFENINDEDGSTFDFLEADETVASNTVYERVIFKYKDPTSPPHTRKKCSKYWKPWHGSKICVGWTINYRWLYRIGTIKVLTASEADVKNMLEDCLKVSGVAALIAGVASGGGAAIAAAEVSLKGCLLSKLQDKLISVTIDIKSVRGDWE